MTAAGNGAGGWRRPGRSPRWIALFVRALRRLPRALGRFEASEIMAAHTSGLRHIPRVPNAFTVRAADPADGPLLERFFGESGQTPRPLSPEDACLVALGEGRIHAVEWIRWGPSEYPGDAPRLVVGMRVPSGSCWLHNGRNAATETVVGPWGMIMGRLRAFLEPRGVEKIFLQVDADDAYSVACHESLGFRSVGCLAAFRFLGARLVGFRSAAGGWRRLGGELDLSRLEA